MAKPKKKSNRGDELALEMTPMIDVVFQLLIFFIVTLKQNDILAALDALRPAPDSSVSQPSVEEPITVLIGRQGFIFEGKAMTESRLRDRLAQIARNSRDAMIMVKCTDDSPHGYLVRALDILNAVGLHKISVFSM